MATAGAVVYLTSEGEAEVERGFTRRDDAREEALPEADTDEAEAPCPAPSLPATLVTDLTAQRTAALRVTLAQQPDVALAAVTHVLARRAFYSHGGDSCLDIATRQRNLRTDLANREACGGLSGFDAERGKWANRLPGDADALWDWCLRQTQDVLLDLLAVSAAHTLDAVREKRTPEDAPRLLHADALAKALRFDMREWFTPTAANYFGRVNRTFIIDALTEAGRPARTRAWSKMKKAELAALAERELTGTGWLPQPLHIVADRVPFDVERSDTRATAVA